MGKRTFRSQKSKHFVLRIIFFAVYESNILDKKTNTIIKKRNYATIPLNVAIERQKQGLPVAPEDENGNDPIFVLSPNDLVYLPTDD